LAERQIVGWKQSVQAFWRVRAGPNVLDGLPVERDWNQKRKLFPDVVLILRQHWYGIRSIAEEELLDSTFDHIMSNS
jgi:hypothetical protein